MSKFYNFKQIIGGLLLLIACLATKNGQAQSTYCAAPHTPVCAVTDMITNVKILGTCMNNSVSQCSGNSRYWNFTQTNSYATLHRTAGMNTYTLSVTTSANNIISVWIDYNKDTIFDSTEWVRVCLTSVANVANLVTITIDPSAQLGDTRMRIRSRATGSTNGNVSSCTTFGSGATHDYWITIDDVTNSCSGSPTAGTLSTPSTLVCQATLFNICISGGTTELGLKYQWQRSPDGVSWSDMTNDTLEAIVTSQIAATYYRYYVVCTNSGNSDTSTALLVGLKLCYCISTATAATLSDIGRFAYGNIDNGIDTLPVTNDTNAKNRYSDFTAMSWPSFVKGQMDSIHITQISSGAFTASYAAIFIDYNQDGNFAANERLFGQTTRAGFGNNTIHAAAAIPLTAKSGTTRLRVVMRQSGTAATTTPCGTYTYGETEDYTIKIDPLPGPNVYVSRLIGPVTSTNCSTQLTQNIILEVVNNGDDTLFFANDTLKINGTVTFGASVTTLSTTIIDTGWLAPNAAASIIVAVNYTFNIGLSRIALYSNMTGDTIGQDDTIRRNVTLVSYITPTSTNPYFEDFENGNGGWISGGTASSWALGTPAKNNIKGAASGINAWTTGGLGTGLHSSSERSYVLSPCMDLSKLDSNTTEVSMDVWWNSDYKQDGASLQYSIDGGASWKMIGKVGDQFNWYRDTFTLAAVKTYLGTTGGWTGRNTTNNGSKGWIHVSHSLPGAAFTNDTKMRIAFGANAGTQDDGFAFDNFQLREVPQHDLAVSALLNPAQPACILKNQFMVVDVFNAGRDTIDFSVDTLNLDIVVTGPSTNSYSETISSGILYPNAILSIAISGTLDMSTSGTYDFSTVAKMQNDQFANNDSTNFTRSTVTPRPLTYLETFNVAAGLPNSYIAKNYVRDANDGKNGTGSLRTTTFTNNGFAYSPSIGPITNISVLKFSYKVSANFKSTDSVAVMFSNDCGQTFTTLYTLDTNTTSVPATYYDIQIDISQYAGGYGVVAFRNYNNSTTSLAVDFDDVMIANRPVVNLGPDTAVCSPLFLNSNPNQQTWSVYWQNGNTEDTITAYTSGQYYVYVIDLLTGLDNSDTINISVYTAPVVNLGSDQTTCPGVPVTFDAGAQQAGNKFLWNTGDTTQTISTSISGTYICTVNTPGNCGSSDTVELFNSTKPAGVSIVQASTSGGTFNAGTSANPDGVCMNDTFLYELTPPSGYTNADFGTKWVITGQTVLMTQSGNSPGVATVTITSPGSGNGSLMFVPTVQEKDSVYMFSVTVKDNVTGCDTTVSRVIKVNALPSPNLGADFSVCPGISVMLSPGAFSKYTWSTGATTDSISVTTAASYVVTVTDANGCVNSDDITLGNFAFATVNLGTDKTVCPGKSVTLDAGTASGYNWSNGATTQTISVSTAGNYAVEIADANGCKASDTVAVTVAPVPVATFNATIATPWNKYTFTPTDLNLSVYAWDFGDGGQSSLKTPAHTFLTAQSYTVWLKTTNATGCSDSSSRTVNVVNAIQDVQNGLLLASVYPNPFLGQTTLTLDLNKTNQVVINLYDITGRKIETLLNKTLPAGSQQLMIDTRSFYTASGVYTLEVIIGGQPHSLRIVDLGSK